jgi:hypothetical protein
MKIKEMDLSNHQGRKINDDSDIAVLDIGQPVSKIYHSLYEPRTYQSIHSRIHSFNVSVATLSIPQFLIWIYI